MNRDEFRGRDELNSINHSNGNCFPVDKASGGTWFGFNQQGTVMALLNRYQDSQVLTKTSRGILIPQLLQSNSIDLTLNQLLAQYLFNPFDLVSTNQTHLIQYGWTGKKLIKAKQNIPFFISSSSVDSQIVLSHRMNLFTKFQPVNQEQILTQLHLFQDGSDKSASIYMSREQTHTKSISQVVIENNSLTFNYLTEKNLLEIDKTQPYRNTQNIQFEIASSNIS